MEVVIGLLIAWSIGKANRVGKEVNGLTDHALDLAVDRVWRIVTTKLGSADPAIEQLVTEAQMGDVSPQVRGGAQRALDEAAAADPEFAAALAAAVAPPSAAAPPSAPTPTPTPTPGPRSHTTNFAGVSLEGAHIGSVGNITSKSKIVQYANKHPTVAIVAVFVAIVLAGLIFGKLAGLDFGKEPESATRSESSHTQPNTSGGDPTTAGRGITESASSAIVGLWSASDSTGTKTFSANGQCDGFYYNQGKPLDIGGPMTCNISDKANAQGRYTLVVTQNPNRSTYSVEFTDADHAVVFDSKGTRLYELERV